MNVGVINSTSFSSSTDEATSIITIETKRVSKSFGVVDKGDHSGKGISKK
jgi:hypothetical protein